MLMVLEGIAMLYFINQSKTNQVTPRFIFDFVILYLQFFYYRECVLEQDGLGPTAWSILLQEKFRVPDMRVPLEDCDDFSKENFYRLKQ